MTLFGKLLLVDLTDGTIESRPLPAPTCRKWLAGRTLNVVLLYHYLRGAADNAHHKPDPDIIDPLAPENPLIFSCGLLTGTPAPSSSRLHINAVSPLTGLLGSSNVGGDFGLWLRAAGYQTIVVRGRADRPAYLDIGPDGVRIRDAGSLWGRDTDDTHEALKGLIPGRAFQSLAIGPGGENGAAFACIVTDQDHAAGRTGMGAVMGAKRLKAVMIRGDGRPRREQRSAAVKAAVTNYLRQITGSPDFKVFSELGGAGYVKWADEKALMSTRNYRERRFAGSDALDGARFKDARVRARGCSRCPVRCKAVLRFKEGKYKDSDMFRPEFEPMINLGAKCGLDDAPTLIHLDNLLTRLGLDSTSAATAIAFAMDLYDRGIIDRKLTGGLDLAWGNGEAMETLIRQMAAGDGLGGILAGGVRRAAKKIGRGAERFAAHVKGLELTAYHPAALLGSALGYAISSRGGDYNNVYASMEHRWTPEQAEQAFGTAKALDSKSYDGKGRLVHRAVLVNIIVDSLGICKVPALSMIGTFDLENEARLVSALTGWDMTARELFDIGQRAADIERMINIRLGLDPADDDLPGMFFSEDGLGLDRAKFEGMVAEFYRAMGWDDSGRPADQPVEAILD